MITETGNTEHADSQKAEREVRYAAVDRACHRPEVMINTQDQ